VTVDPRYQRNRGSDGSDDAVLTLANPISFGSSGEAPQAVQFATDQELDDAFGAGGFVTGWGVTSENGDPPADANLRGASIPLQPDSACANEYGSGYVAAVMICAGGSGTDTCQGDSGGPLTVDTDPGSGIARKLVGITSSGIGCGRLGVPGYYTWVQSQEVLQVIGNPNPAAAPAGPPVANPRVTGVYRVGRTVTCDPPSLDGATATQYFWYRSTGTGTYPFFGRGRTIKLPAATLGKRVGCDVRYEGPGGFVYKESPASAFVGPVGPGVTIHVYGPAHPRVGRTFATGATGTTGKRRVLQVTIHRRGKCRATYGADKASGSYIVFARYVGPGNYDQERGKLQFTNRTRGHYCAYLSDPNALTTHPPVVRDSKPFGVVEAGR
jgi:hypothetical protein